MIESKIIEWLDFGDSVQILDSYSKKNKIIFYRFLRALNKNKDFSIIIIILFILLFFIQIWTMCIINVSIEKDYFLEILDYLKNITIIFQLITSALSYKRLLIIFSIIIIFVYILIIIVFFTNKKSNLSYICFTINLLNLIIYYYLIGPVVEVSLTSFWCEYSNHKYLRISCFSNSTHLMYIIFSLIMLLLFLILIFFYSFFCNEIEIIKTNAGDNKIRIDCNYELFCLISKIIIFIIGFFFYKMDYEEDDHIFIKILYESYIFINCLIMSIYTYKNVYFYNNIIHYINHFGWYFSTWYSLAIIIKTILNIKSISNIIVFGWIIITFSFVKGYMLMENILISETNIFEFKNTNLIEIYKNILLNKLSEKDNESKILIHGTITKFEEFVMNNPEINFQYLKLLNDKNLNKKFNKEDTLPVLSIIYVLYSFYYQKSFNKEEITFHMCYFLINKLNNVSYAMFLCSKLKSIGIKNLYYKYLLMEDIKEYLISDLNKKSNKESIKHAQLGNVILYYLYIDLFKLKIYDAINNQIDYFDILKNKITTNRTSGNFLKFGENIFKISKEIMFIWEKIIELNPFSDEYFRDYIIYLESIIQDEFLARNESEKYIKLKKNKLKEKYNINYKIFITDTSSILLVDGYLSNWKILYSSKNFSLSFKFSEKDLINLNIDDLLPNIIQTFHKELIDNAIKYSNIKYIFKEPKDSLLKGKKGELYNIKLFVKPVPNLYYGLLYFVNIQKIHEPNFNILLDKDLKINGFTNIEQVESEFIIKGFSLSKNIIGFHIGIIIPDILFLLQYKNREFNISKIDCELKGSFYCIDKAKDINYIIDKILEKIKKNENRINYYYEEQLGKDSSQNIKIEFNHLVNELNEQKIKSFNIFYKIKLYTFIEGKYKYYRIYIKSNIISEIISNIKINKIFNNGENQKNINKYKYTSLQKKTIIYSNEKKINLNKKEVETNNEKKNNLEVNKNQYNLDDNNKTLNKDSKFISQLNKKENKDKEKQDKVNKYIENFKKENKEKQNKSTLINSIFPSKNNYSNKFFKEFNKIKYYIINGKQTLVIKKMLYLCYIFTVIIIFLIIIEFNRQRAAFIRITNYLKNHLYFNEIKINIGILYTICVNIRWLSHSLYSNGLSFINEEWSIFHKNLLEENIKVMEIIKNNISSDEQLQDIIKEKYEIDLYFYKYEEPEKYFFNLKDLFYNIFNNGIKILDSFDYFINNNCEEISKELGLNEICLKNLIEQTYYLYNLDLKIITIEEIKNSKNGDKIFFYIPYSFIISLLIFILIIIFFNFNLSTIYKIEIYFLEKLINFNSISFDNYIKKLEEIKKKLKSDNNGEDDKEDEINLKDEIKGEDNDTLEGKNSSEKTDKEDKDQKQEKSKKNKIQQQRINKLNLMKSFFRINILIFQIKIILIFFFSLIYYFIVFFVNKKYKNASINFYLINESINKIYKNSYDIFILLKRKLEIYENNLINCKKVGINEPIEIPNIGKIETPKFGNLIMQITRSSEFKKENMDRFNKIYESNACEILTQYLYEIEFCEKFWNGVLLKGLEQAIIQMDILIGTVLDEIKSLNDVNNKTLLSLMSDSSYIEYAQFNEYYLFKAYMETYSIFNNFRKQKLNLILKKIRIITYIFVVISIFLSILLIFSVYNFNYSFNSFLNFIVIFPSRCLCEDENLYNEIIKFGNKYF